MQSQTLQSGAKIPAIGLGTWQIPPETIPELLKEAIKCGYRHLDCAAIYGNESSIGEGLSQLYDENIVKRFELFITSKLWCTEMTPEKVEKALDKTLADLKTDYVDLYLIHWPLSFETDVHGKALTASNGKKVLTDTPIEEIWYKMNEMVTKGKAKAVGVSNFTKARLQSLIERTGILPAAIQIELHPYLQQEDLVKFCLERNIAVEAYSPLGSGKQPSLLDDGTVKAVALKEDLSNAQVLINWAIQRGTIALVRTTKINRLEENIVIKALSEESFKQLSSISTQHRYVGSYSWTGHDVFADDE